MCSLAKNLLKNGRNGNITGQTCNNLSTAAFKSGYKCITLFEMYGPCNVKEICTRASGII